MTKTPVYPHEDSNIHIITLSRMFFSQMNQNK